MDKRSEMHFRHWAAILDAQAKSGIDMVLRAVRDAGISDPIKFLRDTVCRLPQAMSLL